MLNVTIILVPLTEHPDFGAHMFLHLLGSLIQWHLCCIILNQINFPYSKDRCSRARNLMRIHMDFSVANWRHSGTPQQVKNCKWNYSDRTFNFGSKKRKQNNHVKIDIFPQKLSILKGNHRSTVGKHKFWSALLITNGLMNKTVKCYMLLLLKK